MLALLFTTLAFASDSAFGRAIVIKATTASAFSWTALQGSRDAITVATFTANKVSYDLKCTQAVCAAWRGSTKLAANLRVSATGGLTPTVDVVIDGTDAGYVFSGITIRWAAPNLPSGTSLHLGGATLG